APAVELRLQLLAGRQVPLLAVELPHVEVIQLVAALVARVEDTVVPREIGDRVRRVGRRSGQRGCRAATRRHAVDVEATGLIRGEEDALLVGGERRVANRRRREELLDRVLLRR